MEIRIYKNKTKYNGKRCSTKFIRDIYSINFLSRKEVKELEKTLKIFDPFNEYYKVVNVNGTVDYFMASKTKIYSCGKELLLSASDVELSNEYYYHHSATRKDYLCANEDGKIEEYSGRFGDGYIIHRQINSSKYHLIEYYIKKGE